MSNKKLQPEDDSLSLAYQLEEGRKQLLYPGLFLTLQHKQKWKKNSEMWPLKLYSVIMQHANNRASEVLAGIFLDFGQSQASYVPFFPVFMPS